MKLFRSYATKTVHAAECTEFVGRVVPWIWALGRSVAEVRAALTAQGGTQCPTCQPLGAAS